jgi:hypothetical protein
VYETGQGPNHRTSPRTAPHGCIQNARIPVSSEADILLLGRARDRAVKISLASSLGLRQPVTGPPPIRGPQENL